MWKNLIRIRNSDLEKIRVVYYGISGRIRSEYSTRVRMVLATATSPSAIDVFFQILALSVYSHLDSR